MHNYFILKKKIINLWYMFKLLITKLASFFQTNKLNLHSSLLFLFFLTYLFSVKNTIKCSFLLFSLYILNPCYFLHFSFDFFLGYIEKNLHMGNDKRLSYCKTSTSSKQHMKLFFLYSVFKTLDLFHLVDCISYYHIFLYYK